MRYVLRSPEKALGFICYGLTIMKEPAQIIGIIAGIYSHPSHQDICEELLLNHALHNFNQKKAMAIGVFTLKYNKVLCTKLEKLGFTCINKINYAMAGEMHSHESPFPLYLYLKNIEENLPKTANDPVTLNITKENYEQEIIKSTQPVVIYAYNDLLIPCRHFAPIFEEAAAENKNYKFVRFNIVEEEHELIQNLGIEKISTLIFVDNQEIKGKELFTMNKETLQKKLNQYFS